jgi:two-component system CheB/CheR fusion protein
LIDELNHRVKNMLMVVMGVAEQTLRTSSDLSAFRGRFLDRLQAMSGSYELLSRENWTEASIGDLVRPHVAPFGPERVGIEGPDIRVKPRLALSLGMVIHELVTNASKYGALSSPTGRLDVAWSRQDGRLELQWREMNGPAVTAPKRRGFGLTLVEREVKQALGGRAQIDFAKSGLVVHLSIPA